MLNATEIAEASDGRKEGGTMKFHALANIFPLMEGEEFAGLVADIKEHGLRDPIITLDDRILDGRNRYRACQAASIEPRFRALDEESDGDHPLAFVISHNLKRRHLKDGQRAMIAASLSNLKLGDNQHSPYGEPSVTREAAAKLLNVKPRTVDRAREVRDHAEPELKTAVEQGHPEVATAADATKLPANQQREVAERATRGEIKVVRKVVKAAKRAQHEKALAKKQIALPDKRYGVIVADPEWRFETWSEDGKDHAAENHYPTSTLDVINARDVPSISAPDCVLFLWSTTPMLPQALEVMAAWEFTYRSNIIWAKNRIGTGYWFRNKHELLLVGTRGKIPAPAPGTQAPSILEADVGRHSEKPEAFLELVERYFPTLTKIELNRRGPPRPGWDAWGNEVEQ
jgi:N6-adenosine-specific RNA methylase IME4